MVRDRLMNCVYNTIQTLRWDKPLASLMVPWCCSIASKHGIQTLSWDNPWPCLRYLGVAHMRVKHNASIELRQTTPPHLWYPGDAQMRVNQHTNNELRQSPPCGAQMHMKHDTNIELRQSLRLIDGLLASLKCKYNTIPTLSWDNLSSHWRCSVVPQMRGKHNTNIVLRQSVSWCCSNVCKPQ